jgi:glutaredoxin
MSIEDLYSKNPKKVVFYSKTWCPDCHRARAVLSEHNIPFRDVDISKDAHARDFVKQLNHGNESVPTIIFPDGTFLVEPNNSALESKIKNFS